MRRNEYQATQVFNDLKTCHLPTTNRLVSQYGRGKGVHVDSGLWQVTEFNLCRVDPRRSRMRSITSALLVTVAFGALATAPYFVFRDDSFARLMDHQTQTQTQIQISYDDQIDDLRAQIERMSHLDRERIEEIKSLRERQETLEQVTSGLAKDRLIQAAIQARNGLPSGTDESATSLSYIKTTSGNSNAETGKQAEKITTSDNKKARVTHQRQTHVVHQRQTPVVRKRTQEAPAVAAERPVSQQTH